MRSDNRVPDLPASAEVVVVGGGVIGTSIAFHLAEAGVRDVVLLERHQLGSGSTCKAAGGVRAQFSDTLNIQLGARSIEAYARFANRPGQDIDLQQVGYLFLLTEEQDVIDFEAATQLQNELGVPTRMVDAREARRLCPLVVTDDVLAASYSPIDGHCTPESVVLGYASGARRYGARLVTHCRVTGIEVEGGQVRHVVTDRGRIATSTVVCAAGAWSRSIGAMAGVELPVCPERRQIAFTAGLPLPPSLPLTIDFSSSLYFHREGAGLLLGISEPGAASSFDASYSDAWLPHLSAAVSARAPEIVDVGITGGWAGLYEMTPDHNALIGEAAGLDRFLYATGFSGHGFLQGPAVGEVMRDLVLERPPFVDVSPLDAGRFTRAQSRKERNVV